jgi:putative ABC transport system permease protein
VVNPAGVLILWQPRPALAARTGFAGSWNDATFTLARGADPRVAIAAIDRALEPWGGLGAYGRDQQLSHRFVSQELEQLEVLATRVPVVFLLVAAFLLNVVLGRLIQLQREQLAVLRALGYRRAAIARHVGAFAAVIVGLGGAVGVGAGAALGGRDDPALRPLLPLPRPGVSPRAGPGGAGAGGHRGAALTGALAAMRNVMKLAPAEAMRAPAPARYRRGVLAWRGLARALGPLGRMIVRELERRPIALGMSVIGVGFAVAIVVVGRFSRDSLDALLDDVMARTMREDAAVVLARPAPVATLAWFGQAPGVLAAEPGWAVPVGWPARPVTAT